MVGREKLHSMVQFSLALEPIGLLLIGADYVIVAPVLSLIGTLLACQGTNLSLIQRKTTGTRARNDLHRMQATTSAFAHHFGSFLVVPNLPTAAFVTVWRVMSISAHSMPFLQESLGWSRRGLGRLGTIRQVLTVYFAQVSVVMVCVLRLFGVALPSLAESVADGLVANALGHAVYLWFRANRVFAFLYMLRGDVNAFKTAAHFSGKTVPELVVEASLLVTGAALLIACWVRAHFIDLGVLLIVEKS